MPVTAKPEDTFDINAYIDGSRPALQPVTIKIKRKPLTLVLRSNDVDDMHSVAEMAAQHPEMVDPDDPQTTMECIIARCLVAVVPAEDAGDLSRFEKFEPALPPEDVHKLRMAMREGQWLLVRQAMIAVSMQEPDPEYPSSPES